MKFYFKEAGKKIKSTANYPDRFYVILIQEKWNDFGFQTLFNVLVKDFWTGIEHKIGRVKIGMRGQELKDENLDKKYSSTLDMIYNKNEWIELMDQPLFSVGVDEYYYERLLSAFYAIPNALESYFYFMGDISYDKRLLSVVEDEEVFKESFLRSTSHKTIRNFYERGLYIFKTENKNIDSKFYDYEKVTPWGYSYFENTRTGISFSFKKNYLEFYSDRKDHFNSNIHVLIGSNGVGKSKLLDEIIKKYCSDNAEIFNLSNIVLVSFSPFDKLESYLKYGMGSNSKKQVRLVSLKDEKQPTEPINLKDDLVDSIGNCINSTVKTKRAITILRKLSSDPIFKKHKIKAFLDKLLDDSSQRSEEYIIKLINKETIIKDFDDLSSGHKIILYTTFKLIDVIDEHSLVLYDEPELYLHPPLLSSFIHSFSELLIDCNAMAIVCTHSPVVLQEIPKQCVHIIRKLEDETKISSPEIQTFGESIDVLTNVVFGLEVYDSGYYKQIFDYFQENKLRYESFEQGYSDILLHFDNSLGSNAENIINSLLYTYFGI